MIPPLVELGLLAGGLAAALALFLSVKQEVHAQARKNSARMDMLLQQLHDAQRQSPEKVTQRQSSENEAPPREETAGLPRVPFCSGMNLNKRVQAERLLRRGEDVNHVAAALGLPRREIELLIHVQKMSAQRRTLQK
jgi:hypothetical protein